jgi:hypothetical protein
MLLLATAGLVVGCGGSGTSPEADLYTLSESVNFDAVTLLGPHEYSAEMSWEYGDPVTRTTTESVEILWGDWDNFQTTRRRDGRVVAQTKIVGGRPYVRMSADRYRSPVDGELYRVELRHGWNFWGRILDPFRGQLSVGDPAVELWEEREASAYELSHNRDNEDLSVEVESARLVLDNGTAVRLFGEFEGSYFDNGDESKPVNVELEFRRTNIGRTPTIIAPPVTVE